MEEDQEYDQQLSYDDDEEEEITQEDAWAVISAYFEEKGLVRQQLDSFDEFIQNTMQEIVDESAEIEIRPESQHNPGHQLDFAEVRFIDAILVFLNEIAFISRNKRSFKRLRVPCEIQFLISAENGSV